MSEKYKFDSKDWEKWGKNFLTFSAPSLLAAAVALQSGVDWRIALGMVFSSLLTSAIDWLRKFTAENNQNG